MVIIYKDSVNHPDHYSYGKIECIDYLDAIGVGQAFCRGNVIKYLTRIGHKEDDLEDAQKAVFYAQHIVDKIADGTYKRDESSEGHMCDTDCKHAGNECMAPIGRICANYEQYEDEM